MKRFLASVFSVCLAAAPALRGQQGEQLRDLRESTKSRLEAAASKAKGLVGYSIVDLTSGESFHRNPDWIFPQGSAIKIPVLMELYKQAGEGRLDLKERIEITSGRQTGGSGVLKEFSDGLSALSLRDLAMLMILVSDNSATNILIGKVGMENVNATMRSLGLPNIRLQRVMMDTEARGRGDENLATPREAARLMEMLHKGEFLDRRACGEILDILRRFKRGGVRAGLPESHPVAFKPGGIPGVSTEWAIVELEERPYVVVFMGNYGVDGEFGEIMREISAIAFEYFSRLGRATRYGTYVDPELIKR